MMSVKSGFPFACMCTQPTHCLGSGQTLCLIAKDKDVTKVTGESLDGNHGEKHKNV